MRLRFTLAAVATLCLSLAACNDDTSATTTTLPRVQNVDPPTTLPTTTTGNVPQSVTDVSVAPSTETAHLTAIRAARHENSDRITFEFDGPPPGYNVSKLNGPLRQDGSGDTVAISGSTVYKAVFSLASRVEMTGGLKRTYTGPDRFSPSDTQLISEVVFAGDFEGYLTWGIGLKEQAGSKVSTFTGPSRIVIDFTR